MNLAKQLLLTVTLYPIIKLLAKYHNALKSTITIEKDKLGIIALTYPDFLNSFLVSFPSTTNNAAKELSAMVEFLLVEEVVVALALDSTVVAELEVTV